MAKPVAVLLSDVHYSLNTIALADEATRQAIAKANELRVTLVVTGDLHDSKALMRAECVNAMYNAFKLCNSPPYFLVGNHDRINEKAPAHALNFLSQHGPVIDKPTKAHKIGYLIPYHHDPEELKAYIKTLPKGSTLVMHQGITGSNSGEYIQDKSAITKDDVAGHRVISGHYHTRQTINLPGNGKWDYIGNPYTLNFGEASDPEKGFQILMDDGTLEFVPTNLRKHVVIGTTALGPINIPEISENDLVKVNFVGIKEQISKYTKEKLALILGIKQSFKLEYIVLDINNRATIKTESKSQSELLDSIIDSTNSTSECKLRLKQTWRDLCES